MTSLRTQSNSETACLVSVHTSTHMFAFHFFVLYMHLILMAPGAFNNFLCFGSVCVLAKRSMLLNMTSGSLEAFGGEASRAEL